MRKSALADPRRARCRQLQACRRDRDASKARQLWLRRARESSFRRHWVRRRIFAFGGGGRVEVFMECWSAAELGPRSRRARDRRAAPSRGGMRRNILQAKTLLTHPSGRRLSFSRYWARLKPRSESLARYVSCIQSSCILNTTPAVLKPAQACTVSTSLSQGPSREKNPGIVRVYLGSSRYCRVYLVFSVTVIAIGRNQSQKSVETWAVCRKPEATNTRKSPHSRPPTQRNLVSTQSWHCAVRSAVARQVCVVAC